MDENNAPDPVPVRPSDPTTMDGPAMAKTARADVATPRVGASPRRSTWQAPGVDELRERLPQYEVRSLLGCGGMGAVYQGWQKSLDRLVAIKVLNEDLAARTPDFVDRFKREARTMARLDHPHIVAVYDAGEAPGGLLYFVMEYVDGTDVQDLVTNEGRLPPEKAVQILEQVCDALAYAHQRGVVHRDIKPSNIMVDRNGCVKVADFGLVKVPTENSAAALTRAMAIMGTPDYMAPEAMSGIEEVDHRVDIYAVGVTLYVMLTGHIPRGRFEVPSRCVPGLNPRFDHIVDQAMQRDPAKRYGDASEIRRDLEIIAGRVTGGSLTTVAATGGAVEQAHRPDMGPLVVKMCDRTVEYEQFLKFFTEHAQRNPEQPQVVFIRGWERERLDSLVARFCGTTLRRHAERIGGLYQGALDERELVEWPTTDSAEARYRTLLQLLFDQYDCPAVPVEAAATAQAFARLATARRYPLVVFQFQVPLARWSEALLGSLELFLRFWDEVGRARGAGGRRQFVVFIHLIYPEWPNLPGWLEWVFFRPSRIEEQLRRLIEGRQEASPAAGEAPRCPALLLRELAPVERNDVLQWFKRHRVLGDSMKVWQTRCQEIFGSRLRLPMMDVEDALVTIYEQHLERRRTP